MSRMEKNHNTSKVSELEENDEKDMTEEENEQYSVFSFYGRVGRGKYLLIINLMVIAIFIPSIMWSISEPEAKAVFSDLFKYMYLIWSLMCIYVFVCVGVKRCHDVGISGWHMLWAPNWNSTLTFDVDPFFNQYGKRGNGISPKNLKVLAVIVTIFLGAFVTLIYAFPELVYYLPPAC